jgi:hypothetical protein
MTKHDIVFDCYICSNEKKKTEEKEKEERLLEEVEDGFRMAFFQALVVVSLIIIFCFITSCASEPKTHADLMSNVNSTYQGVSDGLLDLKSRVERLESSQKSFQAFSTFFKNVTRSK